MSALLDARPRNDEDGRHVVGDGRVLVEVFGGCLDRGLDNVLGYVVRVVALWSGDRYEPACDS